jgi:predicted nuclease of predicted toxin-antitoxin system
VKILLDECIDRRFAVEFSEHEVKTVPQMGWAGVKNGSLMKLAEDAFDVFVTVDRNLSFQQNLPSYNIAVIVLRCVSNRYKDLAPFGPKVLEAITNIQPGSAAVLVIDR